MKIAICDDNREYIKIIEKYLEDIYVQTDNYLGKFLRYLDEGATVLIFSDHAQVASAHTIPLLFDMNGCVTTLME